MVVIARFAGWANAVSDSPELAGGAAASAELTSAFGDMADIAGPVVDSRLLRMIHNGTSRRITRSCDQVHMERSTSGAV